MNEQNCYGDGTVYRGVRSKDSEIRTVEMTKERELLRRAYELLDRRGKVENFDKRQQLLFEIHTYFSTPSDDAVIAALNKPAEPARKPMTEEEIDEAIGSIGNLCVFKAGVRFAEKHHGIGGDDDKQG